MANLTVKFTDEGDADVRIAFVQGNGSWSYLGTMVHEIPSSEPTMNYGWADAGLPGRRGPQGGPPRIRPHARPDPRAPEPQPADQLEPGGRDRRSLGATEQLGRGNDREQYLQAHDPGELSSTPTDPESIMMYPIPAAWTTDGFSVGLNEDLSATDRDFIREAYPW